MPEGYLQLGSLYYDVDTTAAFTGQVMVCLGYNLTDFTDPQDLQLLHFDGANWVDVTASNDMLNGVICGLVAGVWKPKCSLSGKSIVICFR